MKKLKDLNIKQVKKRDPTVKPEQVQKINSCSIHTGKLIDLNKKQVRRMGKSREIACN
jgi:hypothetical protein